MNVGFSLCSRLLLRDFRHCSRGVHAELRAASAPTINSHHQQQSGFKVLNGFVDASSVDYARRFINNGHLGSHLVSLVSRARAGGSSRSIARHRDQQRKILVRDRISRILDQDFPLFEIGTLAAHKESIPSASCVTGVGKVNGHFCVVSANDATVKGGTIYPIGVRKQLRAQEISEQLRLPFVHLVDSGGAFLPLQAEIFPDRNHGGRIFYNEAVLGAKGLSQISIVCGSCTAGGAYVPTMCDHAVIVDRIGSVFLGGPPLVRAATGETVTAEQLGGATVHCRDSGCTDYMAKDESEAFGLVRDIMSTLRVPNDVHLPSTLDSIEPLYSLNELQGLAGSQTTDRSFVSQVLARILDASEFLEFRALYGDGLVCGFGKLGGRVVGVVAATGKGVDYKSAQKACQLVQVCDDQGTPVIILQRTLHDGWSYNAEDLKSHAQLMSVMANSNCHKIAVNIGNCFGSDYFSLCGRSFSPVFYLAWPNAQLGYSLESNEDDPTKEHSVFEAASRMWLDEIISPDQTRNVLIDCLRFLPPTVSATAEGSYPLKMM